MHHLPAASQSLGTLRASHTLARAWPVTAAKRAHDGLVLLSRDTASFGVSLGVCEHAWKVPGRHSVNTVTTLHSARP